MSFRPSTYCVVALLVGALACSKKESNAQQEAAPEPVSAQTAQAAPKQVSVGRHHLPDGCEVVVTLDWQRVRKWEAVKADVEKEIGDLMKSTDVDTKRAVEFLKKADIDLLEDPAELAVCLWQLEGLSQGGEPSFVMVIGGRFRPGAAIEALDTVTERLKALVRRAGSAVANQPADDHEIVQIAGVKALRDKKTGALAAQAKNGAFVIASDQARFEKALTPSQAHAAYKLGSEPVGLAVTRPAKDFVTQALATSPFAAALQSFAGAYVGVDDQILRITAHFDAEKDATLFKQQLDALVASAPSAPARSAKIQLNDKVVSVEVPLPKETMDGVLGQLPGGGPARPAVPSAPQP